MRKDRRFCDRYQLKVDKWYPSSQMCSHCGRKQKMKLSDRTYRCTCGMKMDRDHNAAINILNEGLRLLRKEAA
ncbi:MAG: zinc ribbon domain-containing protein [Lachnospiraceae bacterium]|nr:zinc ribbon domain-containing protein [Lachnospiraceae bacterium]